MVIRFLSTGGWWLAGHKQQDDRLVCGPQELGDMPALVGVSLGEILQGQGHDNQELTCNLV